MHVFHSLSMSSTLSTSETRINTRVAQLLAKFPNNLEPDALLSKINVPTMGSKGDLDDDTLGHAYYTLYYGLDKPLSSVRPADTSLLKLYGAAEATSATAAINVVKQTDPAVYVASVCDAILPHRILPAPLFCQAIRNINPHELKNDYYHLPNICGYPFDEYLKMVNARLQEYFTANRSLDDVLSGIKKCLCLRMLSNNMYYYRDHPSELDIDPAIQKLMQFYTRTDFLHVSSQEAFSKHAHMVRKYKQLQHVIEELISPSFKKYANAMSPNIVRIVTVDPAYFELAIGETKNRFNHVQDLQAFIQPPRAHARFNPVVPPRMSSSDMVHKVQSHLYSDHPSYPSYFSNPRLAFDEGIRFMQLLTTRLDKPLDDRTYNDLFKIYELTSEALLSLHKYGTQTDDDDEKFFKMMKKLERYNLKYRRPMLTSGMVDWSKFAVAGPARSPSPLTRKRSRSRSPSPSRSKKRPSRRGGAKSKTRRSKTRK